MAMAMHNIKSVIITFDVMTQKYVDEAKKKETVVLLVDVVSLNWRFHQDA